VYANAQCLFVSMTPTSVQPLPVTLDNTIYYCGQGSAAAQFVWQMAALNGFTTWKAKSHQDKQSLFADPDFVSTSLPDLDIMSASPAIGAGADLGATLGVVDFAGNPRVGAARQVTIGAYQGAAP
jgi:hypothetical protein